MKIKRGKNAEKKKVTKAAKEEELELTMLESIEEELAEDGINLFDNDNVDEDYLRLPRDITEEESKDLGRYFNAFTQQKMWTRTLIGRVSANVREGRAQLDKLKSDVFLQLPAKMSVKEKELHFRTHEDAEQFLDDLTVQEERLNLLTDYIHNLEDGIFNISREISRRGSDWTDERREENIGKKRR
jgi:hypothetical protein